LIVSIHQPNYLPWIGFFEKIYLSDIFVYFDNVQMPKNKSFVSRNKILFNKKSMWLTVPINKKGIQTINEVKIIDNYWKKKHLDTIYFAYKKEKYFEESFNKIKKVLLKDNVYIADLNIDIIEEILRILKIQNVKIIRASQLSLKQKGAESIFEILKTLNAKVYISGKGKGSLKYVNDETLKKYNIKLKFCNTNINRYTNLKAEGNEIFSILDLLFRKGVDDILKNFSNITIT
tara:strand:- start:849 stop:1547 length:699 start_codon:yes stop_codon:yes gene_type:complete